MDKKEEKTVLITNASRWLSIKAMKTFLAKGYKVIAIDERTDPTDEFTYFNESIRKMENLSWKDIEEKENVTHLTGDLNDEKFLASVVETLKNNNVKLNSVLMYPSIFQEDSIQTIRVEDIDTFVNTIVKGPLLLMKYLLPMLRETKGAVEIISSALAENPQPNALLYSITEAALIMMMRTMTITEGKVKFNAVLAGPAFTETLLSVYKTEEEIKNYLEFNVENRLVLIEDIVEQAWIHIKGKSYIGDRATVDCGESETSLYSNQSSLKTKTKKESIETTQSTDQKTVLITGGSSGIGLATAEKFLEEGYKVYVLDINKCPLEDENLTSIEADVTNEEAIIQAFESIDHLNVLVNCAGIYKFGIVAKGKPEDFRRNIEGVEDLSEITAEDFDEIFDINVKGYILVLKHAMDLLKKSKGNVIMVSSGLGIKPEPTSILYCMTKAAINTMVKALADNKEIDDAGLTVNAVLPGPVMTPLLVDAYGSKEIAEEYYKKNNPLGIVLTPGDIAKFIWETSCKKISTGSLHAIDGGEANSTGKQYLGVERTKENDVTEVTKDSGIANKDSRNDN